MKPNLSINLNENFDRLPQKYLFSEIAERVNAYKSSHTTNRDIISLGIGDVTLPLSSFVANEMATASLKMATKEGFFGYGNTQGDERLRNAISDRYFKRGVSLDPCEIFINDGAKSDLGALGEVFGEVEVLICEPVYPVYLDSSIISGRKVSLLSPLNTCTALPTPENIEKKPYLIYLCSPNNPTGAVFDGKSLKKWVDFALESGSQIIFDAAYESYITDSSLPHSIFEMEGAKSCAIEVCSFSKFAGFTGIRCGWTAISRENPIHLLWKRRQSTKFNGASYISQVGALASLSPQGEEDNKKHISYYMENATLLIKLLESKKIPCSGGKNAPYLWFKCPNGCASWEFFDLLLKKAQIVGTPGLGFGKVGKGHFRFSSFASRENILEAIKRLEDVL